MPFIAQTCLTNVGTTQLGPTLYAYSDYNSFLTPFKTNIALTDIVNNCPYDLEVPNGTTIVRLYDPISGCYCDIPISSKDICTTCDINFNEYSASTVGRIVAGNVTGSCDTTIDNYVINWIGPSPSTNVAYISGKGDSYSYNFEHPLTGDSAIFAQEGTYTPVIDKIEINGVQFSQNDLPNYVTTNLDCFNSVNIEVSGFTCDNGGNTSDDPNYEHRVKFLGAGRGLTPQSLQSTFILSATTNYFAWSFQGFNVADTLKLTFIGSAYSSNPIILDYITIGDDTTDYFNNTVLPNRIKTSTKFTKVTTLTGLTVNAGDRILIEVIPNPDNTQTNWDFYFTCLETFNCDYCGTDNSPFKIIQSTITNYIDECNRNVVNFNISGCSLSELNNSDFTKYVVRQYSPDVKSYYNYIANQPSFSFYLSYPTIGCILGVWVNRSDICSQPTNNYIRFEKSIVGGIGQIDIEFSDLSDLTAYYSSYQYMTGYFGSTNDTDITYYTYMRLDIPNSNDSSTPCGDGVNIDSYYIHQSSVVTTGDTSGGSPYTMSITMPTITNNVPSPPCSNCNSTAITVINMVNPSSTGTTNNRVVETNVGSRYVYPFIFLAKGGSTSYTSTAITAYSFTKIHYGNVTIDTYPVSGSSIPYTLLTEFSGTCCPNITDNFYKQDSGTGFYELSRYSSNYRVSLTNPSNLQAFKIEANIINPDGSVSNVYDLVYEYDGTSVIYTNPAYLI